MAGRILATIVDDAIAWTKEGGLQPPFHTNAAIRDCGFQIEVTETEGKQRSASASYTKEGVRSMYQLDKWGG